MHIQPLSSFGSSLGTMEKSIITTSSCEGRVEQKHKTIWLKSPSSPAAGTRWSLLWLCQVVLCQNMVNLSESNPFIYILHLMEKKVVEMAFSCLYSSNIAIIFVPQQSLFCYAPVTFPERLGWGQCQQPDPHHDPRLNLI